jgi:hypothetical protein
VSLGEIRSEHKGIPDEIQRAGEYDRGEAERRIEAFAGFAECFFEYTNPPAAALAITMRTR